jgi:predicted nucleic acid-binding protein
VIADGARHPGSRADAAIERLLAAVQVLAFDDMAASAAEIRCRLEARGAPTGMAYYLIAGICLSRPAVLLTRNWDHFGRVPGLRPPSFEPR